MRLEGPLSFKRAGQIRGLEFIYLGSGEGLSGQGDLPTSPALEVKDRASRANWSVTSSVSSEVDCKNLPQRISRESVGGRFWISMLD